MTKTRLLLLLPVAAVACSDGAPVDIGHDQAQLKDFAANWDGHAEAWTFSEGGSDRVRLTLDVNGEGTLEIGDAAPLPAPTDPDVGLPMPFNRLREGFKYPVHDTKVEEGGRIRLTIDPYDIYADWCAIEHPVAVYDGGQYACAPIDQTVTWINYPDDCRIEDAAGTVTTLNCEKLSACKEVCTCTAEGCAYVPERIRADDDYRISLDATIDITRTSVAGTLVIPDSVPDDAGVVERVTVRLQRK